MLSPSGGTFGHQQLMQLWTSNGGSKSSADIAAAIAQAESSGNPDAISANPDGGTNVGLWQLDTKGKGAGHSIAQLQDPATNARLAVVGSRNGSDWSAWATFTSGAYRSFLSGSQGIMPTAGGLTNPPTGLAAVGAFFSSLGEPSLWLRIGEVAVGLVLLGIGVNAMFKTKPLEVVTKAAGAAAMVVPK